MRIGSKISVWELEGLVYLDDTFRELYERRVKEFGVTKISNILKMDYATVADIYRRSKPMKIGQLLKSCRLLNIGADYAEKSITGFTQNLKTKYSIRFPISLNPLSLRLVAMITGDGTMDDTSAYWIQHCDRINYGVEFLRATHKFESTPKLVTGSNCGAMSLPKFFVDSILNRLNSKSPKDMDFFEAVVKLPRDWQFQVFAQLVVDEGSPDTDFKIFQMNKNTADGIDILLKSLGYRYTRFSKGFYINTESFTDIKTDFGSAVKNFGKFGGFWFKDERFRVALRTSNPGLSRAYRIYGEKFSDVLNKLGKRSMFTYKDMEARFGYDPRILRTRIDGAIRDRKLFKINRSLYTTNQTFDKRKKWLSLSKEEKVLKIVHKYKIVDHVSLLKKSELSESQFYRAINNLLEEATIKRTRRGFFSSSIAAS